jgi:hypothetical protein
MRRPASNFTGVWREVAVGLVAGAVVLATMRWRDAGDRVPPGIYQAQIAQRPESAVAEMLAEPREDRAVLEKMAARLPDVRPGTIRMDVLLRYVEEVSGADFRVDWDEMEKSGSPRDRTFAIDLTAPTGAEVLRAAFAQTANDPYPLGFQVEGGAVRVSTRDVLARRVVTRAYDVRDLVADAIRLRGIVKDLKSPKPPATGPSARSGGGLFGGPGPDPTTATTATTRPDALLKPEERSADLSNPILWKAPPQPPARTPEEFETDAVEELVKFVAGIAYEQHPGQFRSPPLYFGGRLLVTASPAEQERVASALKMLRAQGR